MKTIDKLSAACSKMANNGMELEYIYIEKTMIVIVIRGEKRPQVWILTK